MKAAARRGATSPKAPPTRAPLLFVKYCTAAGHPARAACHAGGLNSVRPLSSDIDIDKGNTMHMLYDSESFVVVHMLPDAVEPQGSSQALHDTAPAGPQLARHGFEIVDKRSGKEVYLDGLWAELFQRRITEWQQNTPTQEEVEDTLEGYAELAQNPVVLH